ncbi:hypothetical protein SASPL_137811 [Salvia splendens]|uniref:Lipoxygenase domain-containing protein n=1 Tax=Salvia splendens TaxID=180675 RepID=A0A8X8WVX0_SALSN|nr:hypothetical protein SASPL_137811 [Salvia splendens]
MADPLSESRSSNIYIPRDEAFSEIKQATFNLKPVYSMVHDLVPSLKTTLADPDLGFPFFSAIDTLFDEGVALPGIPTTDFLGNIVPRLVRTIEDTGNNILRFETPKFVDRDRLEWLRDAEFARQTLAGINPCAVQLVTEWPLKSKLDPEVYGPPESAITTELVEQDIRGFCTIEEGKRAQGENSLRIEDALLLDAIGHVKAHRWTTSPNGSMYLTQAGSPLGSGCGGSLKPTSLLTTPVIIS